MDEEDKKTCKYARKDLNKYGILCEHADETCYTNSDDVLICTYLDDYEKNTKDYEVNKDISTSVQTSELENTPARKKQKELEKRYKYLEAMRGDDAL